ncbi:MAG: hypothetical protein J0G95_11750 [Rhizobiales bacterium]|nr:hypothetical protein [Hyphomicrobiales bacterium]
MLELENNRFQQQHHQCLHWQDTTINISSALLVSAISDNTFNSYSIVGAVAGLGAVAGMANATIITTPPRRGQRMPTASPWLQILPTD